MSQVASAYSSVIAAITIWREARGENFEAQRAIAWVIFNRMLDDRWPADPIGVCQQRLQFSCWNLNDPNVFKWPRPDDAAFLMCCKAWEESGADPTDGANHYHSFRIEADFPNWADPAKVTARIGAFTFYRL